MKVWPLLAALLVFSSVVSAQIDDSDDRVVTMNAMLTEKLVVTHPVHDTTREYIVSITPGAQPDTTALLKKPLCFCGYYHDMPASCPRGYSVVMGDIIIATDPPEYCYTCVKDSNCDTLWAPKVQMWFRPDEAIKLKKLLNLIIDSGGTNLYWNCQTR